MRFVFLAAILLAPVSAQTSRTVADTEKAKVIDLTMQPQQRTRPHLHNMNRVLVYLDAGTEEVNYMDYGKTRVTFRAGEAKWSPITIAHISEITSSTPVRIVEIELKTPGRPGKMDYGPLDPVKLDPKHYVVELENDQVRVLRVKIGPRETVPMHEHRLPRVVAYLTDQDFRVTGEDGKVETPRNRAGHIALAGAGRHKEENVADKLFEVVVVELK